MALQVVGRAVPSKGETVPRQGHGPAGETLAVSVHGPAGVLDLAVPVGARATDIAREYAAQSGLASVPLLHSASGVVLAPDLTLAAAGVDAGDVLVATTGVRRPAHGDEAQAASSEAGRAGPVTALGCGLAGVAGVLAGWFAAQDGSSSVRDAVAGLLVAAAIIGVAPLGRRAVERAVVAPAFGAAAALALVWDPTPERLPMVLGVAALAGAVTAGVARALAPEVDDALTVWMVVGGLLFAGTGLAAVLGVAPATVWALLLVLAVLAARFVPDYAVDVPDEVLLDLERLAVTAWSARDRPQGRRTRMIVRQPAVAAVVARGTRIVAASGVAILVVCAVAAPLLLVTATAEIDRLGARALVFFSGAALLLAGRSFRHSAARVMLRAAGLVCWGALVVALVPSVTLGTSLWVAVTVCVVTPWVVVAAVATGRGWRSVWWSRRAEVAEAVSGALAIAAICVASGLMRNLWELVSVVFRR
ncbi:hypothetical protein [Nocardioides sp.]|uniref:hypothetical protein n=1 Tax=Nocardioides sp. TaxID=35761 RepID=UPI00273559D0|nr:hypothetical protein [Nocardioides sp.]MDP3889599.1 hypothetical protein [Nocardioides sp.]